MGPCQRSSLRPPPPPRVYPFGFAVLHVPGMNSPRNLDGLRVRALRKRPTCGGYCCFWKTTAFLIRETTVAGKRIFRVVAFRNWKTCTERSSTMLCLWCGTETERRGSTRVDSIVSSERLGDTSHGRRKPTQARFIVGVSLRRAAAEDYTILPFEWFITGTICWPFVQCPMV